MAGAGDLCAGRLDLAEIMPPVAAERFSTSVTLFGYRCAATTGTAGHIVSGRSDDLAHRLPSARVRRAFRPYPVNAVQPNM